MELFRARGYTETTVEEIASRAGLTERTFFRYFADKREVLFSGAGALKKLIADGVAAAPNGDCVAGGADRHPGHLGSLRKPAKRGIG